MIIPVIIFFYMQIRNMFIYLQKTGIFIQMLRLWPSIFFSLSILNLQKCKNIVTRQCDHSPLFIFFSFKKTLDPNTMQKKKTKKTKRHVCWLLHFFFIQIENALALTTSKNTCFFTFIFSKLKKSLYCLIYLCFLILRLYFQ